MGTFVPIIDIVAVCLIDSTALSFAIPPFAARFFATSSSTVPCGAVRPGTAMQNTAASASAPERRTRNVPTCALNGNKGNGPRIRIRSCRVKWTRVPAPRPCATAMASRADATVNHTVPPAPR